MMTKSKQSVSPDWRGLCAELLSRLEESDDYLLREEGTVALASRARKALAQPEPEAGPTDEELDALVNEHCWDPNEWIDYRSYARAILADLKDAKDRLAAAAKALADVQAGLADSQARATGRRGGGAVGG